MWRLASLLLISACASQITPEEREARRLIDRENWVMCEAVYAKFGQPTYHRHEHDTETDGPFEIKEDLAINGCKGVLRDYWIDY